MEELEEQPMWAIRQASRQVLRVSRRNQKYGMTDYRRSIETSRIDPDTIADIPNKLKNKSALTLHDLHILKNILIDDENYIEIVLSTNGALRGLIRELSGRDVKRQCAAAGCLCNLALGDTKACVAIAKAGGHYLTPALDSTTELAVTSAWALGNIAGAGARSCELLCELGAAGKLAELLGRRDAADAAVYALTHVAYQMKNTLSIEYVARIIEAYSKLELNLETCRLLFYLSCHEELHSNHLPHRLLLKLLDATAVSMERHVMGTCKRSDVCCELLYLLRTLANISVTKVNSDLVLEYLIDKKLLEYFKTIIATDNAIIKLSSLWLLGNLFNSSGETLFEEFIGGN
ncbi:importin subunit alpha-2 [Ostrinia furnacalis]|uniref:importin subunit alpha-2 n=1 Tax=Ostrinia furnacalis TaxID=93504 RepID=UPI00103E148D|nr:importin subunit alpha-2 [Ostrinia furnacalis]